MFRWLGNALNSSIGRKLVMALTGLMLVGFLLIHLVGNMKVLPGFGSPEKFDSYVHFLWSFGGFLVVAEIALGALFLCHIYLALRLTMENIQARKQRYTVRNDRGAKTFGSASMFATGSLMLLFLIKHLIDFRFNADFHEAPADTVAAILGSPLHGTIYILAAVVAAVHLSHGFQSAFQSLGINHPRWTPLIKLVGLALSAALGLGFSSLALYFLFFK
ncbi:MAG: succinate dehydrogenase / fumarate reductase cytochrome b subunit [Planctomycetota bacterium]|jgi:succinate dehydrogenase / fumarate reductase cytochrome b subunit